MSPAELSNRLYSIFTGRSVCAYLFLILYMSVGDHSKRTGEQGFFGGMAQKILCRCERAGEKAPNCTAVS